jgi:hypothetical protein
VFRIQVCVTGAALALFAACAQPRTSFDEKLERGGFGFVIGEAADESGFDVLQVAHDGECRYVYKAAQSSPQAPGWRALEFRIEPDTLRALKRELNLAGLAEVDRSVTSVSANLPRAFIWLRVGSRQRLIDVRGNPPPDFAEVAAFVHRRIIDPRRAGLAEGLAIDAEEAAEAARFGSQR